MWDDTPGPPSGSVTLNVDSEMVRLQVLDNGIGIIKAGPAPGGMDGSTCDAGRRSWVELSKSRPLESGGIAPYLAGSSTP